MKTFVRSLSNAVWEHPGLAVALFVAAFGMRISDVDRIEFRTISAAPFTMSVPAEHQFLYGSPFTFFLGSYYRHHGLDDRSAFAIVHGLGELLFFASAYKAAVHAFGEQ